MFLGARGVHVGCCLNLDCLLLKEGPSAFSTQVFLAVEEPAGFAQVVGFHLSRNPIKPQFWAADETDSCRTKLIELSCRTCFVGLFSMGLLTGLCIGPITSSFEAIDELTALHAM